MRNFGEIDFDAGAGACRGFTGGTGQARRAHVLNAGDGSGGEQLEASLANEFFHEGVAHLNSASLLAGRFFGKIHRSKSGARQTVPASSWTNIKNWIANASRLTPDNLLVPQNTEAKSIDQRIAVVAFIEIDFASDRWKTETVAVMRDAGNDAAEEAAVSS